MLNELVGDLEAAAQSYDEALMFVAKVRGLAVAGWTGVSRCASAIGGGRGAVQRGTSWGGSVTADPADALQFQKPPLDNPDLATQAIVEPPNVAQRFMELHAVSKLVLFRVRLCCTIGGAGVTHGGMGRMGPRVARCCPSGSTSCRAFSSQPFSSPPAHSC